MKALSVKQPWADLLVTGLKSIEVRTWKTHYRGPLLICASAKPESPSVFEATDVTDRKLNGFAVGIVEISACKIMEWQDWYRTSIPKPRRVFVGKTPFGWFVEEGSARTIRPFPVKGQLGLFDVPFFG